MSNDPFGEEYCLKTSSSPKERRVYLPRNTFMCFYENNIRIDIKEEDFDIKHKTKSQYNGPYTPKSMILDGWEHWRQEDSRSIPF